MSKAFLIVLFWMLGILSSAGASERGKTYYVDSEKGDDRNHGLSEARPKKSLPMVEPGKFGPGDRILLKRGSVFQGVLKVSASGSAMYPLIISSYGEGEKARIEGPDSSMAAIHVYNAAYVQLSDLEVVNQGRERLAGRSGVRLEIEDFGEARGIVLSGLDIRDVNGSLVKAEGGGAGILVINKGKKKVSVFHDLRIINNTIRRCERNGIIFSSEYYRRDNWHPGKGLIIRGNLIEEVPGDGIVPIGYDGALIEYNVMRKGTDLLPVGEAAAGIWPWSCDNTVVQFNEVSGHRAHWDGQGFDSDYNSRNTLIQYNYSHDNDGGFLLICDNGSEGYPYNQGNTGTTVRFNISVNDGIRKRKARNGQMFSPAIHLAGPVDSVLVHDNIIYLGAKELSEADRTMVLADSWDGVPQRVRLVNNIFCSEEESGLRIDPASDEMEFADNQWYGSFKAGGGVSADEGVGELRDMKTRILELLRVNNDGAYPILLIDTLRLHKLFIKK